MKKFLTKIFAYILVLGMLVMSINLFCLRNYDPVETIANVPDGIQICNVGSSHGYFGFNYEDAARKYVCFNFALQSQSLRYDLKVLENYRDKIRNGAYVFVPASYFSFFGRPETQDENFESKNKRYYRFLRTDLIDKYDAWTYFYVRYFPSLNLQDFKDTVKRVLHKTSGDNRWDQEADSRDMDGFARYEYHVKSKLDEKGHRIFKQEAVDALRGIIAFCREIGATPVLVTPPYLHEYSGAVHENDPQFFTDFYGVIDGIVKETGIKYYDYSEDERFKDKYEYFFNSDHMNRKGARFFTNILLRETVGINVTAP